MIVLCAVLPHLGQNDPNTCTDTSLMRPVDSCSLQLLTFCLNSFGLTYADPNDPDKPTYYKCANTLLAICSRGEEI